jgi:BirA family biotin operon repressor/biotin-[acetyl-CoA-carboxylase] ligase
MISSEEIQRGLRTKFIGKSVVTFEVIDSTNTAAKKLAENGAPEGTAVIAEHQTAGRGRFDRTWHGEARKNIILSLILRPREDRSAHLLTYLTALCVANTAEHLAGVKVECKWPNDLLVGGKKICGILLESAWSDSNIDYVIVGIGMNVNQETFPDELQQTATSLKKESGQESERGPIIRDFFERFEHAYLQSQESGYAGFLTEWKMKSGMFGKEISLEQSGNILRGRAIDLDTDGALVIENHDRVMKVFAGDVTVLD